MSETREVIVAAISSILAHRGADAGEAGPDVQLGAQLGFNSLEFAELSAQLEEKLGHDPYSAGEFPDTVDDIEKFYAQAPPASSTR